MNLEDMENFRDRMIKKFGVMPFKQSDGGIGLMGKGSTHSYEYTDELENQLNQEKQRREDAEKALSDWIAWEESQINKEGEYTGVDINNLINQGRSHFDKYDQ